MIHPLRQNTIQLVKVVLFILATLLVLLIWGSLTGAEAQQNRRFSNQAVAQSTEEPLYREYKGVRIGMTADEVRAKLGEPKDSSDAQFFYVINEKQSVQIAFDATKKVTAISIDYVGLDAGAPEASTVVGAQVQAQADGSFYKLIRYPKYGFWVSYNQTAGQSPIITVTIQKF